MKGQGRIVIENNDKYALMKLEGSFNSYEQDEALRESFRELTTESGKSIIVDFNEVHFFNSTAIRGLLSGNAFAKRKNCKLIFCNLNEYVYHIFQITNLDHTFSITENLQKAEAMLETL